MKTVRELLAQRRSPILFIAAETSTREAAIQMDQAKVGSVLVGSANDLAGIFTERDLMRRVVKEDRSPSNTTVGAVMTTSLITCTPDATLADCASMMSERKIRHLPVVEGKTVVGIITTGDILAHQLAQHEATIQHLESFVFYVRQ